MWDLWLFIVSGRLPGTAIQITFEMWLKFVAMLLATYIAAKLITAILHRKRAIRLGVDTQQTADPSAG
jgi:hypothetical protein